MSLVTVGSIEGKKLREKVEASPELAFSSDEIVLYGELMFQKLLSDIKDMFLDGFIQGYKENRVIK